MIAQTSLFPDSSGATPGKAHTPSKSKVIRDRLNAGRDASHLFTVNSISGGRSSAMMATEHPADMNIFGIVTTDDPRHHIKDAGIRSYVWKKLQTDLVYATLESDETIQSIMDLEQYIGQEIIILCGDSMDSIIESRNFLPNARARFCTYEMKIKPIFNFLLGGYRRYPNSPSIADYYQILASSEYPQPGEGKPWIRMNIGYRLDDIERVASFTEHYRHCVGIYQAGRHQGRREWKETHWRIGHFPIVQNSQADVIRYWKGKPVNFPEFNNCEFCFNRTLAQLQKQFRDRPEKGDYWIGAEEKYGAQFRSDYSLKEIKALPMSDEMDFTAQSMCNSGGCTD